MQSVKVHTIFRQGVLQQWWKTAEKCCSTHTSVKKVLYCLSLVHEISTCDQFWNVPSVLLRCWLGGRKGIRPVKKLNGGVLAWLSIWSNVRACIWPSWCHCHSLSLASVKSRLVFTSLVLWYWLTWALLEKGPFNVCMTSSEICVLSLALGCDEWHHRQRN